MTTTKQSWFKRSLSVLLAVTMVLSMGVLNVFAAEEKCPMPVVSDYSSDLTCDGYINTSAHWQIDFSVPSEFGTGYKIYLTFDGSEPDKNADKIFSSKNPFFNQSLIDDGYYPVVIKDNVITIKAMTVKDGMEDSDVLTLQVKLLPENCVGFNDKNLKKAVWDSLDKEGNWETDTISKEEMLSLTSLVAEDVGITNLSGLEFAENLEVLDLSGNDLNSILASSVSSSFDFSTLTKLKTVDLSDCNIGSFGVTYMDKTNEKIAKLLKTSPYLESVDLSGNNLAGNIELNIKDKDQLKTLDLSDNYLAGISFQDDSGAAEFNGADAFPALTTLDFSNNCYEHKETSTSYADFLTFSSDVLDISGQKSLATALAVIVQPADGSNLSSTNGTKYILDLETKTLDIGETTLDTVNFAVVAADPSGKTKATVQDNVYTALTATDTDFTATRSLIAANLEIGRNEIPVTLLQENGATDSFTLIVTRNAVPSSEAEDSAGVTDPKVYAAVASQVDLEKDYITKKDMEALTGSLTINGAQNLNGLEYAVNLTGLTINDGAYTVIPDISKLTALTKLSITSSKVTSLPDLTGMVNLTDLTLKCSNLSEAPKFGEYTAISKVTLALGDLSDLSAIPVPTASWKSLTLTLGDANGEIPYDGLTSSVVNKILSDNSAKISTLNIYNAPNLTSLGESTTTASRLSNLLLDGCPAFEKIGVNAPGLYKLDVYGNNESVAFTFEGLENCKEGLLSATFYEVKGMEVKGLAENNKALKNLTFDTCDDIVIPKEIGSSAIDNISIRYGNGNVSLPDELKNSQIHTLYFWSAGSIGKIPDVAYEITSLTNLTVSNSGDLPEISEKIGNLTNLETLIIRQGTFSSLPKSLFSLTNLTTLNIDNTMVEDISGDWGNLSKLKQLSLQTNQIKELPMSLTECTSLTALYMNDNYISSVPAGFFGKLPSSISTLWMTCYFDRDYIDNSTEETKADSLSDKELGADIKSYQGKGMSLTLNSNVADLLKITANGNSTYLKGGTDISVDLPEDSTSLVFVPETITENTQILYNGKTYQSGEEIKVDGLTNGLNTVSFSTTHTNKEKTTTQNYTLSVYVGNHVSTDEMVEGNRYSIAMKFVMEASDTNSMTNNYFLHREKVVYKDGQYAVNLTTTAMDLIGYLDYKAADGSMVRADIISEDVANNTCTYRVYVQDLNEPLFISPMVYPMGYAPTCRVIFDTTSIMPDSNAGIDTDDLNAAINRAIAITEKRNVYTDDSYKNFLEKLEAAQATAETPSTQEAVNAATEALETAMMVGGEGGLVIDESKLANKTALETAINEAKALEKGNHTDTAWNALQDAIADAQAVYDTLEASQNEVDTAAKALNTAVTLFQNSGESSSLDKNNLKDGVYSVYGEMIKTNRQEKSMSNDAINHYIKLTVEDGKYYLNMDFHGLAYLNKFGYLAELSYYDNGYTYGQYGTVEGTLIPATVLSTQKNPDGSDLYDEFNQAGGSYEGKLYPDQIKFPLVTDALADEDGYVPLHVFVPVMEDISTGTGDQDVLLKLDWSTLTKTTEDDPAFEPEEPVEQSPAVDYTDAATGVKVNADKGVFDEGVQIVVSEITSGAAYDSAASSLSDVGKKFKLYDVKFLDADGNEVAPNGTVSISFPVAAGYDSANLAVYRLADGGKVLVKGAVEDGYYTVITKTAGTYALVEKGSAITDEENTENVNNDNQKQNGSTTSPQTGDNTNIAVYALLALAASGMMGVTLVTRKRKSEEA